MSDFRITYTKLAGLAPPQKDAVIRLDGLGSDGPLYRVLNEPALDDNGSFFLDLQPL